MFKKFLTIGVLAISVGVLSPLESQAYSIAGWNIKINTIDCTGLLKGIRNVSMFPVQFVCTARPELVEFSCINPAGNADPANGEAFLGDAAVAVEIPGADFNFKKNGTAEAEAIITDEEIFTPEFLAALVAAGCPNQNWSVDPDEPIVIRTLEALIELEACGKDEVAPGCFEEEGAVKDTVAADCMLPEGQINGEMSCVEKDPALFGM